MESGFSSWNLDTYFYNILKTSLTVLIQKYLSRHFPQTIKPPDKALDMAYAFSAHTQSSIA